MSDPRKETGWRFGPSPLAQGSRTHLYLTTNHGYRQGSCCRTQGEADTQFWICMNPKYKTALSEPLHQACKVSLVSLEQSEKPSVWFSVQPCPAVTHPTFAISRAALASAVSGTELFHYLVPLQCGKVFRRDHSLNQSDSVSRANSVTDFYLLIF